MKKLNYRQSSRKLNGGRGGKQKQKQRIFIFEPRTMLLVQLIWDVQPPLSTFPFLSFVLYSPLQSLRDRLLFLLLPFSPPRCSASAWLFHLLSGHQPEFKGSSRLCVSVSIYFSLPRGPSFLLSFCSFRVQSASTCTSSKTVFEGLLSVAFSVRT